MHRLLAPLAACALLGLGAAANLAPRMLSKHFGLPVSEATGITYVRALGARDAVLGLLVLTFLGAENRAALRATLGLTALAGATDFFLVLRARGSAAAPNLLLHGGGTLGLVALWALMDSGERPG